MEVVQIIKELIAAAGPLHGAAGQGVFGAAVVAEGVCLIAEVQLALGRPVIAGLIFIRQAVHHLVHVYRGVHHLLHVLLHGDALGRHGLVNVGPVHALILQLLIDHLHRRRDQRVNVGLEGGFQGVPIHVQRIGAVLVQLQHKHHLHGGVRGQVHPGPLVDALLEHLITEMFQEGVNPSSLHSVGQRAAELLMKSRETVARCLNCQPREIIFTSGGSEADNQALLSAAAIGRRKGKMHIISTAFEHHAILHTLKKLEKEGFQVELLPVHENGMVSARQVADAIREDTCLVTVMYANNEIGSILPIEEIGAVCREKSVLFHTDAVQAAGHLPIDVQAQHIDMLSLSGHKFHGPKGVGALYVRGGIPLVNVIEGGAQERGKRAGTENVPGIAGMAAALEDACAHMEENRVKVTALRDRLIEGLSKIPHSAVNGDLEHRLPGNVSFCFEGIEGESLLLLLDAAGICASSGSACTSGSLDPSHVLLAIGRPHEVAHGSLRLSLCEWNTQEEVDHILREVPRVVEYLRSMSPVWKDLESGKKAFML